MAKTQNTAVQEHKPAEDAPEFLNATAGEGLDAIGANAVSTSYLTILQQLSDAVVTDGLEEGNFYNTATKEIYGPELDVVVCAFQTVWDEKEPATGKTVMRYKPHSIELVEVPPAAGKKWPTWKHPDSGNQVIETFSYVLVLPDHPEAGFLLHTAGIGSMKAYRNWNKMLTQVLLPNGQNAAIYSKVWKLHVESKISKTTNKPFYALTDVTMGRWINQELHQTAIEPARKATERLLLEAPAASDDLPIEEANA